MALPNTQFEGFQPEGLWTGSGGLAYRRGQLLKAIGIFVVTFTSAAVGAAAVTEQAVAGITGSTVNDIAVVMATGVPTGNVANLGTGRISPAGTLQLRYINPTAAALTPPAATVYFIILFQVQ